MLYSPWNKLLSGRVNYLASMWESQVSGQNFPMLLKSPSPPLGICKAAGGTSSKVERAEIYLVALLPPWKVDRNISRVCSSRAQPFQLYSLHAAVRSSQMVPSKAFHHGMDRNATPQRDGFPASRQEGQGSFPCPGEMGLKDGGAWRMGGGMKDGGGGEGRGCPHATSSIRRTVSHLFCSIPPKIL